MAEGADRLINHGFAAADKAISSLEDLQERGAEEETDAIKGATTKKDIRRADFGKLQKLNFRHDTADNTLEQNNLLILSRDLEKEAASANREARKTFTLDAELVQQNDLFHQDSKSPESSMEEDANSSNRELSDLAQSGESWEQMTDDSDAGGDYVRTSRRRDFSDLSARRASATDLEASSLSLENSDSFTLGAEVIQPQVDGEYLSSCNTTSPDINDTEREDCGPAHRVSVEEFPGVFLIQRGRITMPDNTGSTNQTRGCHSCSRFPFLHNNMCIRCLDTSI
ncbi:uncharacterized protein LOC143806885 isoform X1 [Ranitomeya variabilis]|uniref:uncharacterized protein LOC143806885 isoform X1 n=1 Tax=Ranitomeya variabilis TaxID=490064 RepID=UPI004056B6FB